MAPVMWFASAFSHHAARLVVCCHCMVLLARRVDPPAIVPSRVRVYGCVAVVARYPSYVDDIMGDVFALGFGPFRWVCTSGSPHDLQVSRGVFFGSQPDIRAH